MGAMSDYGIDNEPVAMQRADPPPFCPTLVLPHCEAWFATDWLALRQSPDFELIGLSGRPLLRVFAKGSQGGVQELQLTMIPRRSPELGVASQSGEANTP